MAPRWGWGRKLIGTDAKTSAEIANHPQNHPPSPALVSYHRTALPPGLNTPPPQLRGSLRALRGSPVPPAGAGCAAGGSVVPSAAGRGWTEPPRPPARGLLTNAHVVPRRPPALVIPGAPYPCRASLQGIMGGVCFPRLCLCHSVGLDLSRSRFPGARGWAGSRARCRLLFAHL